ncbi:MAG: hypothetical protein GEEBNDBF_00275 [bacterium]|nr:hypothetical protein [bacterium]
MAGRVVLEEGFLARLERLHYLTRLMVVGGMRGEKKSRRHGSSIEFADYRAYSRGDDLRRVDWKVFARTDRFYTKLFHEEEDLTVHLLIDASASMAYGKPQKFMVAQQVAAAMGYIAMANLERTRFRVFGDRLYANDTGYLRSKGSVHKAFRFLEDLEPQREARTDFRKSFETFAGQTKGQGLVIILSDFLAEEGLVEGLKRILYAGHQIVCVQLLDQQEMEPDLRGELELRDAEEGTLREVTISPRLLRMYRAYRDAYLQQFETTCRRLGMSYIRALTSEPMEEIVLQGLRQTRLVGRG